MMIPAASPSLVRRCAVVIVGTFMLRLVSLFPTVAGQQEQEAQALFVQTAYRNAPSVNDTSVPFDPCQDENGSSCLVSGRLFFVEKDCVRQVNSAFDNFYGSFYYVRINNNTLCYKRFSDLDCQNPLSEIDADDEVCDNPVELNNPCSSNGLVWTASSDFCVTGEQKEVIGGDGSTYVTPMVEILRYENVDTCEADSLIRQHFLVPDTATTCYEAGVVVGDVRQPGSFRAFCRDGDFVQTLYADEQCQVQDSNQLRDEFVVGDCTPTLNRFGDQRSSASCSAKFYCKDLVDTDLAIPAPIDAPTQVTSGAAGRGFFPCDGSQLAVVLVAAMSAVGLQLFVTSIMTLC